MSRQTPEQKPKRITWRVEQRKAMHPYYHTATRIKRPDTGAAADLRTPMQKVFGDPPTERSALYQKMNPAT